MTGQLEPLKSGTSECAGGGPISAGLTGAPTLQYPAFTLNHRDVMLFRNPGLRDGWQNLGRDRFNQLNQNLLLNCGTDTNLGNECFTYPPRTVWGRTGAISPTRNTSDAKPIVKRTFDAFGADRIVWGELGTNMPNFEKAVELFDTMFDFASETDRAKIRGLTAQKLFNFPQA